MPAKLFRTPFSPCGAWSWSLARPSLCPGGMTVNQHFFHGSPHDGRHISDHARRRMDGRRLSLADVRAALDYGRTVYTRGAAIHVIGRKEVQRWRPRGVDLAACEGVHVVCNTAGHVLTTYRNRDLRGLRPCRRRRCKGMNS
jgi:hypothetical protein